MMKLSGLSLILLVLPGMLAPALAEPYLVTAKTAWLYAKSRQQWTLVRGQIVEAKEHNWDKALLWVKYRGKQYVTRRKYFRSRDELLAKLKAQRAGAEGRIIGINKQLDAHYARIQQFYSAIVQIQRDAAIYYKLRNLGVRIGNDKIAFTTAATQGGYRQIVPRNKSRKLTVQWEKELAEITAKTQQLEAERRKQIQQVFQAHLRQKHYEALFQRYEQSKKDYEFAPYRVTARVARLYMKQNPLVTLGQDKFVMARPNLRNQSVLTVEYNGHTYSGHRKYFQKWPEVEEEQLKQKLKLEDKVRLLENGLKLLACRMQLYGPLAVGLQYRSRVKGDFVFIESLTIRPGLHDLFAITYPEDRLIVYAVNLPRARKTLKNWKKEVDALADAMREKTEALAAARKALSKLTSKHAKLRKKYSKFINRTLETKSD